MGNLVCLSRSSWASCLDIEAARHGPIPSILPDAHTSDSSQVFEHRPPHYGDVVAALATAPSDAAIALTVASTSLPSPCRLASQLGSLYESQVSPDASRQTSAFNGRSIPIV